MRSRVVLVVAGSLATLGHAQVTQLGKFIPQGVTQGDIFGYSLEFDGVTAAVGAAFDDAPVSASGAVYPIRLVEGSWLSEGRLVAHDPQANATLGDCVAVGGDVILSGAPGHNGRGAGAGAAYVFERIGGVWGETARLYGSDTAADHRFGAMVAMDGGTLLVVATGAQYGVDSYGVVYSFERIGGSWAEVQRVEATDAPFERVAMGTGADVDGDVMVVGGAFSQPGFVEGAGAAYVFERVGGLWTHTATLTAGELQTDEHFGAAVSVSGDTIVVGADDYDHDGLGNGGAVYTFARDGGAWSPLGRTVPPDAQDGDNFGVALELDGPVLAVAAYLDDDRGSGAGKVYLYDRNGDTWALREQFAGDDTNEGDLFGWALGMGQGRLAVAAPYENTRGLQAGAAYVFDGAGPPCPADFNGDGVADTRDVIAFLSAWAAGDGAADFNGDGTVNTQDVLAFLDAWAAGC